MEVQIQIDEVKGKPTLMVSYTDPETGTPTLRGIGVGSSVLGWSHADLKALGAGLHKIEPRAEPEVIERPPLVKDPGADGYVAPRIDDLMKSLLHPAVNGQIANIAGMTREEVDYATEALFRALLEEAE